MFALFNLIILPCAQTTKLYGSTLPPSPSTFPPAFILSLFLSPARRRSLSGGFFPGRARIKAPGSRSAHCGADTRSPWAGARGRRRVRGTGAAPPGASPRKWHFPTGLTGWGLFLFFPRGETHSPVVPSRCSPLRVLRRGGMPREGAPPYPPTPNSPHPAAAPLFACHVYNLVETKTDICGREKMTFTSPDHSLK